MQDKGYNFKLKVLMQDGKAKVYTVNNLVINREDDELLFKDTDGNKSALDLNRIKSFKTHVMRKVGI